jgi:hypothetical protein
MSRILSAVPLMLVLTAVLPGLARAGEPEKGMAPAAEAPSPDFERLKALAGDWEGTARGADQKPIPSRASIKVVSAGSAVMLTTDPGGAHEMVTLFHRDGADLLATHYCAAMNQPRMKARAGTPAGTLTFEFLDGTNLGPHPGRMQALTLSWPDADHQIQVWTYRGGGQDSSSTFELKRKKG